MEYFHRRLKPGIDYYEQADVRKQRSVLTVGMWTLAGLGGLGLVLAAVGIAGSVRRSAGSGELRIDDATKRPSR